jgi:hypothetical protein
MGTYRYQHVCVWKSLEYCATGFRRQIAFFFFFAKLKEEKCAYHDLYAEIAGANIAIYRIPHTNYIFFFFCKTKERKKCTYRYRSAYLCMEIAGVQ